MIQQFVGYRRIKPETELKRLHQLMQMADDGLIHKSPFDGRFPVFISDDLHSPPRRAIKFRDERPGDAQLLETLSPPVADKIKEKLAAAGGDALLEKLGWKKATSTGGGASAADVPLDFHAKNVLSILNAWDEGHDAQTHAAEARKAVAIVLAMYESARKKGAPIRVQ